MVYLQQEEVITLKNVESSTSPLAGNTALSTNKPQRYMNQQLPPFQNTAVVTLLPTPCCWGGFQYSPRRGAWAAIPGLELGKRDIISGSAAALFCMTLGPFCVTLVLYGHICAPNAASPKECC